MVCLENHLGSITISEQYLTDLITHTVTNCFGVTEITQQNFNLSFLRFLPGPFGKKLKIKYNKNFLEIDLHLVLSCGINISESVRSIKHKLRYTIEELTELEIGRINIYVDEIKEQTGE